MEQNVCGAGRELRDENAVFRRPAADLEIGKIAVEHGGVRSIAAVQGVVAAPAAQGVVAGLAEQPVIAAQAIVVPQRVTGERVIAVTAVEEIAAARGGGPRHAHGVADEDVVAIALQGVDAAIEIVVATRA